MHGQRTPAGRSSLGRRLAVALIVATAAGGCERAPVHGGPWRVLVLEPDDPAPPAAVGEGLVEGLQQGVAADAAPPQLRTVRAPTAALAERARQEVDAGADLVLTATTAALAAALPSAPAVVFTDVADPAAAGVRSPALLARWLPALFARQGPPVIGAWAVTDFGALLQLADPILPPRELGTVFAAGDADSAAYRDQLRAFAHRAVRSEPLAADAPERAVKALCDVEVRTLVLLGDRSTDAVLDRLIAAARACGMVSLGTRRAHADAGAVLTLARDQRAGASAAGRRAARFLRGERPQLEPFERVAAAAVIVNAQAAEQAGVGLPLGLLEQADDVIGD